MNVILAAVVDSAMQARSSNLEILNRQKEESHKAYQKTLTRLCKELDNDNSGSLTFEELVEAFGTNPEFLTIMEAMDIKGDDIAFVWAILDEDDSGEVKYDEFAEEVVKMKEKDMHTMITFIQYYVRQMFSQLHHLQQHHHTKVATTPYSPPASDEMVKLATTPETKFGINLNFEFDKFRNEVGADIRSVLRQIENKFEDNRQLMT